MAQRALHAGTTQTRGRALFGLLDASGWAWASLKAVFWFILLIFMLGYVPDRAYYFTVNKTIDLGILAFSPVNFCPPGNETLPCPPPPGAVVPWKPAPPLISLPAPRTDGSLAQSGTSILFVGGSDGKAATDTTFVAKTAGVGNLDTKGGQEAAWAAGPKLPQPRSDASVVFAGGKIYAIGGLGADGKPTSTVYVLTPDAQTGALGEWQTDKDAKLDMALPEPRSGAVIVVGTDGLLLIGGTNGTAPVDTVLKSTFDVKTGAPGKWAAQPGKLFTAVTDASGAIVGDYLWVYGGTTDLPEPRTNLAGFAANGALYAVGGSDGSAPKGTLYWTTPNGVGDIPAWKHLEASDLPATGLAGAAPIIVGPDAIVVGGTTSDGPIAGAARANIAPEAPFFQVGLVGATVPALKIDGEVGQQLGYLNANTIGIVNFVIFLIIGWAFAHREQIKEWRERRRRERELRARA